MRCYQVLRLYFEAELILDEEIIFGEGAYGIIIVVVHVFDNDICDQLFSY